MEPASTVLEEKPDAETSGRAAIVPGCDADSRSTSPVKRWLLSYGTAILSLVIPVALKLQFQNHGLPFPFTSVSLAATALSFWYGGTGPGVLVIACSSIAQAWLVVVPPDAHGLANPLSLINHIILTLLVGWIVASRRHGDRLLTQAHSELELKVKERTASLQLANDNLQSEILERKRAEEALRASGQVAQGQVEALIQNLDVLATAPEPDKFIGQVLATVSRLLNAQSAIMWVLEAESGSLVPRAMVQGSALLMPDPDHPLIKNPQHWKNERLVQQAIINGAPTVCEDLEHDPRVSDTFRQYIRNKGARKNLNVPILFAGSVKGLISIRHGERPPYRPEEIELAQALAHQAMLAIQLTELAEQRQQAAVLEERNRIARDIHDTLAQGFTGVIIQLECAEDAIMSGLMSEVPEHLHHAADLARQSLNEARRSVRALRPQALENATFWEALKANLQNTTTGTMLQTEFHLAGSPREFPAAWQENLLRIAQEALTNALKHAHATRFKVSLFFSEQEARLELGDNGVGFEISDHYDGFGMAGMHERVLQMGGALAITSTLGAGATLVVTLPCPQEPLP